MELSHVGILYLTIVLLVALIGLVIVLQARKKGNFDELKARAATIRKMWAFLLIGIFTIAMGRMFSNLPWAEFVERRDGAPQFTVAVLGQMWSWVLSTDEVPVGKVVEFRVVSTDVNHGFGIYDESDRLVGQIQAMPGYVNRLLLTFNKPGAYRVLCLEYCSTGHKTMVARFSAVPQEEIRPKAATADWASAPEGARLAFDLGCLSCHTTSGAPREGLNWSGLYGVTRTLSTGFRAKADDLYLKRAILDHDAELVEGFPAGMMGSLAGRLSDTDVEKIIAYIKSIK